MQRPSDRRRSVGGCPSPIMSEYRTTLKASPRVQPTAAYRDVSPESGRSRARATSPGHDPAKDRTCPERSGLAAAARLAAASSGDLNGRSSARLLTGSQTERARRHSTHLFGNTAVPGAGSPPPPLRHAWRFTAASMSEMPPPPLRTPQSHFRETAPAAASPVVPAAPPPRDSFLAHDVNLRPPSPVPHTGRERRATHIGSEGPATPLERHGAEDVTPHAASSHFDFGPAAVAQADAASGMRPRLVRARSALRTTQASEPVRSHSADPRRRKEHEREDSVERAQFEAAAVHQDRPVGRRVSSGGGAHGGARTERHGRVGDRLAELVASSALSPALRRPPPFKSVPSHLFGGRYVAGRYLGRGASATVWEASHSESNLRVAVKVFDQGSRDKRQAHREVKVLSRVQHPNVVEAFEVIEGSLYSSIVCELVDGESLRAFAQRQTGHRLEESAARHYYKQVVSGVNFCHDRLVVHRDLKLENLLLSKSGEHVKIIDFGFATQVASRDTKLRAFCGTPSYMAPEIVRGEGYSGFATDVWALGVVVFALLAGTLPFVGRTEMQLYSKIRRGIFTCPDLLGEQPRRLIRAILRLEPSSRPTTAVVLRQTWLSGCPESTGSRTAREGCSDMEVSSVLRSPSLRISPSVPAPLPASGGENESSWMLNSPGRAGGKNVLDLHNDTHAGTQIGKDKDIIRRYVPLETQRPESPSGRRRPVLCRSRCSLPGTAGTALGGS